MIKYIKMRLYHALETIKSNGLTFLWREIIYINREAIPVEKDLCQLDMREDYWKNKDYTLAELSSDVLTKGNILFSDTHRYLKGLHYIRNGYQGFGILRGNEIVGDVWYFAKAKEVADHPDVKWLKIDLREKEVYAFDFFLNPNNRGNNLATLFHEAFLYSLKEKGFKKVYGFFWKDKVPALWMHRMLKYRELKKRRSIRIIFYKKAFDA